ncbi:MAG: transcriptional repressor LexA [Anaerolineales bacterium]|jgi:repressor LexA|nr:transcriptional repressor LexA [Anaerolineales bacterium]
MTKGTLSDRQRRMLEFIQRFGDDSGYPPSIREIGTAVGISSTSVVNYNLNRLVEEGYLDRDQNVSRGIRLTERLGKAAERMAEVVRIPLVGRIFASEPIPLPGTDSPIFGADEAIEITRGLLTNGEGLFALQVQGDSMIDAMINDGDIVVMKREPEWRNGDMVAVWLKDKEATTLKHIYREGKNVRLQPANPTMKPILIDNPESIEVQGKVMLVVRQLA